MFESTKKLLDDVITGAIDIAALPKRRFIDLLCIYVKQKSTLPKVLIEQAVDVLTTKRVVLMPSLLSRSMLSGTITTFSPKSDILFIMPIKWTYFFNNQMYANGIIAELVFHGLTKLEVDNPGTITKDNPELQVWYSHAFNTILQNCTLYSSGTIKPVVDSIVPVFVPFLYGTIEPIIFDKQSIKLSKLRKLLQGELIPIINASTNDVQISDTILQCMLEYIKWLTKFTLLVHGKEIPIYSRYNDIRTFDQNKPPYDFISKLFTLNDLTKCYINTFNMSIRFTLSSLKLFSREFTLESFKKYLYSYYKTMPMPTVPYIELATPYIIIAQAAHWATKNSQILRYPKLFSLAQRALLYL